MKKLVLLTAALISFNAIAQEHPATCSTEKTEVVDGKERTIITAVPCAPGKQKTVEQLQREEDAALKHKCGNDFRTLRIGMKVDRLEECVGATYETETVTQKGTVETWRTNFDWVNVQNGVVIGYTKRTY